MLRFASLAALIGLSVGLATAPARADRLMAPDEVKSLVTQYRIYLSTPLGGELPLTYYANGRVDGSGEAIGLGRWLAPKDSGRWWMSGNRLCQQWEKWYEGRRFCFTLERAGDRAVIWRRDDGEQGRARIARR
jgi:hypothetical protein